jgi:hypothetical protein
LAFKTSTHGSPTEKQLQEIEAFKVEIKPLDDAFQSEVKNLRKKIATIRDAFYTRLYVALEKLKSLGDGYGDDD